MYVYKYIERWYTAFWVQQRDQSDVELVLELTVCFLLQIQADQPTTYQYLQPYYKKSKYITRVWRGVDCVFESLIELQGTHGLASGMDKS